MTISGALLLTVQPSNFWGHEDYCSWLQEDQIPCHKPTTQTIEESIHGICTIHSYLDMKIFPGETTVLSSKYLHGFIRKLGQVQKGVCSATSQEISLPSISVRHQVFHICYNLRHGVWNSFLIWFLLINLETAWFHYSLNPNNILPK